MRDPMRSSRGPWERPKRSVCLLGKLKLIETARNTDIHSEFQSEVE